MIRRGSLLLFILLIASASLAQEPVKAWEGTIDLPTYDWKADPYPRFWALDGKIIYPYTMEEVISTTKENRTYKALYLENDYLKVTCLPELGGRIFSVLNKVTGKEMFHKNKVVKPGLIGMRGAWISGGVEWNTGPHGHTVTAISPVNALVRQNKDGSATLHISNTEQIFRTCWNVDVTLYPDRSFLHEEMRIYNPQDGIHPYYFWNCTAFPCGKGTRFIFPMTLGCNHNGDEFFNWPIHEGKDISWLKNYDKPTSIFAWECDQDFFGCYDVDLNKGLVQVADHRALKGKKAWTWGQSDDGLVSQEGLTDEDGPYIEVQSGPLRTQADYGELSPREEVAWEEWWYPVYGFDQGFDYATKDVVFEVKTREGGGLEAIHLLATKPYPGCRLTFEPEGGTAQNFEVDLTPREPKEVKLEGGNANSGQFLLTDSSGGSIAEFQYPLPLVEQKAPTIPKKKDESEMTVEELFAEALEADRGTSRKRARELYEKVIAKASDYAEAHFRLGVLDFESGLWTEAKKKFQTALDLEPSHSMARYFHGTADFHLGNYSEALRTGNRVVELEPNLSLGYDLKGRALMRLGRRDQVIPEFEQASQANTKDFRAWEHLAMAFFGAGRNSDAFALARDLVDRDPTALIPRAILAFEDPTKPRTMFEETLGFLGEADFEYVEAMLAFESLAMPKAAFIYAMPLLADRFVDRFPLSPMQHIYSSALALMNGSAPTAEKIYNELGQWNSDFVFPSRTEAVNVLQAMKRISSSDGRFPLLLGDVLANLGRIGEATVEWESAIQKDPTLAQAHRNLGLYYWKEKEDPDRAEAFYRRAIDLRPKDPTLYVELSEILSGTPEKVVALLTDLGTANFGRNELSENLARAYNELGEYQKTINFLGKSSFSNWENRKTSRNLWVAALIGRGKNSLDAGQPESALADFDLALTYPRHLGVGRPADPNEAEAHYWRGVAFLKMDNKEKAKEAFEAGKASAGNEEYRKKCEEELGKL